MSHRDELAKAAMESYIVGTATEWTTTKGRQRLAEFSYALADAMLAEAAKGKQQPSENDLSVPPGVMQFLQKRAEGYEAWCSSHGDAIAKALRETAYDLESLNAADLPEGERPLCQRTCEVLATWFDKEINGDDSMNSMAKWAGQCIREMAQEAKGDG